MNGRNRQTSLQFLLFSVVFVLFSFSAAHAVNLSGSISVDPVPGGGQAFIGVFDIEDPNPGNVLASVTVPVSGTGSFPYSIDLGASTPSQVLVIGFYDKNNSSDPADLNSEDNWPDYGDVLGGFSTPVTIGTTDISGIDFFISTPYSSTLPDTLSLYDDFTSLDGRFAKDKWFFPNRQLELVRQKKSGKLFSSIRSAANSETNKAVIKFSGDVNQLKTDIRIDDISTGEKNDLDSYASADIGGIFFNTDYETPTSYIGSIFARSSIRKTNGEPKFIYQIVRLTDATGANGDLLYQGEIPVPGGAELNTWYQLEINYNQGSNTFAFTVADASGTLLNAVEYNNLPERKGPSYSPGRTLTTQTRNDNTQSELCHVFAQFDNLYVNGSLYDDFNAPGGLDPAKWASTEAVKAIEDGKALLMAESKGVTETSTLRIVRSIENTSVDVKIAPESRVVNGSKGRFRLEGNFYNDTFGKCPGCNYNGQAGEVWAQVYLTLSDTGVLSAKYYMEKPIVAQPLTAADYQTILDGTFDIFTAGNAIQTGRTYRLGINFTGSQMIFSCTDLDSSPHVTQSVTYNIPGPAYSPSYAYRAVTSRVYGSTQPDAGGKMIAQVEKIETGNKIDTDGDGLSDFNEFRMLYNPYHGDMDGDGIMDGNEDRNVNGRVDENETDPRKSDTDGDGIKDGVEIGLTLAQLPSFAPDFVPDSDPSTTTDPQSMDSDEDGLSDGTEDTNHNGRIDAGESNPIKGTMVSGRVLDTSGNPVSGLWVHAFDAACGGNWLGGGRTDENGYYTMYEMHAGNVYVQACANCDNLMLTNKWWTGMNIPGAFSCNDAQNLSIMVDGDVTGIDFVLDPAGSISGYVRDDSGNGLSGIHVFARSNACDGIQYSGSNTNDQGYYLITGIPEGNVDVYACPECNNQNSVGEWYNGGEGTKDCNGATGVAVQKNQVTADINFNLQEGVTVSGRVLDNGGNPISGLWVQSFDKGCGGNWLGGGRTDVNGNYTIYGVAPGNVYVQACASCDNFMVTSEWWSGTGASGSLNCNDAQNLNIPAGVNATNINFALDSAGGIFGRVVNNDNIPLQGIHVYAEIEKDGGRVWVSGANTDGNGNYTLTGLPAGNVYIRACPGCVGQDYVDKWYNGSNGSVDYNAAVPISVVIGQIKPNYNFTLDPAGRVAGYVKDESGQAISGVHVVVRSNSCSGVQYSQTNTDVQGYYLITGIPEGNVYVYACPECNNLNFVGEWYNGGTGTIDCNGAIAVGVSKGNTTVLEDTVLKTGNQLIFTINGVGVEGMYISVHDWHTGNFLFSRRVDSNTYTLTGVPEASQGKYRVYLISGDTYYVGQTYPVEVVPGQTVVFTPVKGGRIAGTITGNGYTLRQVCVNAEQPDCTSQFMGGSASDNNGVYGFAVQPGIYVVSADSACNPDYHFFREYGSGDGGTSDCNFAEPVSVELEQDTIMNFDLEPGGMTIGDYDADNDVDGNDLAEYLNRMLNEGTIVTLKDLSERFGQ